MSRTTTCLKPARRAQIAAHPSLFAYDIPWYLISPACEVVGHVFFPACNCHSTAIDHWWPQAKFNQRQRSALIKEALWWHGMTRSCHGRSHYIATRYEKNQWKMWKDLWKSLIRDSVCECVWYIGDTGVKLGKGGCRPFPRLWMWASFLSLQWMRPWLALQLILLSTPTFGKW